MTDHGQLDQDPQIVAFSPELLKLADRRRAGPGGLPPGGGGRRCQRRSADGRQLSVWRQRGGKGPQKGVLLVFPDGGGRPGRSVLAGAVL